MIDPNDPEKNSDILSSDSMPPAQAPPPPPPPPPPQDQAVSDGPRVHRPVRPMHEQKTSNDSDLGRFAAESTSRPTNGTKHQVQGAHGTRSGTGDQSHKRVAKGGGAASGHRIDTSPIHLQGKVLGRGNESPSGEGRVARNGSQGTPGRSRFGRASQGDELFDKGSAIPRFGDWDDNNPACADGYTHVFNNIREDRQNGARNGPGYMQSPYRPGGRNKAPSDSSKICCFPWRRS